MTENEEAPTREPDNSATRLHKLLEDFTRLPPNMPAVKAWESVLRLPSPSGAGILFGRLSLVHVMTYEISDAFEALPNDGSHEALLRHLPTIGQAFALFPQVGTLTAQNFQQILRPDVVYSIEVCGLILHSRKPQWRVPQSTLAEIRKRIARLIDLLSKSDDLDDEVVDFLLERLYKLQHELHLVSIRGRSAVEEAFDVTLGALTRQSDLALKAKGHPLFGEFGSIMAMLVLTLEIAVSALQLPTALRDAIDPSPASEVTIVNNDTTVIVMPPSDVSAGASDSSTPG